MIESRRRTTELLVKTLGTMSRPPRIFVGASAIGYYGDHGDATVDESSGPGSGFLSEVCVEWETLARPLVDSGMRVAHARIGVVLSPKGGGLKPMLLAFRLGAGGPFGHGRQFMSWISMPDMVGLLHHALICQDVRGPFNAVSPNPVANRAFAQTLGKVLRRPAIMPAPAFALRAILGELADGLLLSSLRVIPSKAQATGYRFRQPDLEAALRAALGKF